LARTQRPWALESTGRIVATVRFARSGAKSHETVFEENGAAALSARFRF